VFHTAYKRTFNTLKERSYSNGYEERVVVDPVVYKMYREGYDIREIDTAWKLSQSLEGIERRIAFQAYCQQFVDNAISSTVNLPPYAEGSEDAIGQIVRRYAHMLRGITFYPDGRHNFQPVQPVDFTSEMGFELRESESCKGGVCSV
jgi:ribonucleoside-diphosphate reductase alpha chain